MNKIGEDMVKTNRKFRDKFMIIKFEIDVSGNPSMISSKDLEECFKELIGFTAANMRSRDIKQAFARALKKWGIKY